MLKAALLNRVDSLAVSEDGEGHLLAGRSLRDTFLTDRTLLNVDTLGTRASLQRGPRFGLHRGRDSNLRSSESIMLTRGAQSSPDYNAGVCCRDVPGVPPQDSGVAQSGFRPRSVHEPTRRMPT